MVRGGPLSRASVLTWNPSLPPYLGRETDLKRTAGDITYLPVS
jgi:hypothetical protein